MGRSFHAGRFSRWSRVAFAFVLLKTKPRRLEATHLGGRLMMSNAPFHRRTFLRSCVGGSLLLPATPSQLPADHPPPRQADDPLAPRQPHCAPKATRVIFLFSTGGVSHMDTFDYKPRLFQADGRMTGVGGGLSLQQTPL